MHTIIATVPRHMGFIMDGNRRWAKERGLPAMEGHRQGLETVKKVIKACGEKGIDTVTFFCFSTENWNRSKQEVDYLMNLFESSINDYFSKFKDEGIRIRVIGQKNRLSPSIQKAIADIEKKTEKNEKMTVNLAISYGGRTEIVEAIKNIIKKGIDPETITEDTVKGNLWTSDVDLVIRTGKEQRISNFLIWQAAYSEFRFVPKFWPDFNEQDIEDALSDYASRQRRFGK